MISEAAVLARYSHWPAETRPRTRAPSPSLNRLRRTTSATATCPTTLDVVVDHRVVSRSDILGQEEGASGGCWWRRANCSLLTTPSARGWWIIVSTPLTSPGNSCVSLRLFRLLGKYCQVSRSYPQSSLFAVLVVRASHRRLSERSPGSKLI